MSNVVNVACGVVKRRASGYTPTNFGTILPRKSSPSTPRFAQSAPAETFIPPLRKKNGVRNAKATTRMRCCSVRCRAKCELMTRPRTNAGSTAWEFARAPSHMSRNREANTSLISGSITRSPYRPEEPRRQSRQPKDEKHGDGDERRDPDRRLDEQDRERRRRSQIRYECRRHQPFADGRLVETRLDEDCVHHGEARRGEGNAGDLGLTVVA